MIHHHIYRINNFNEHKHKLVSLINKIPETSLNDQKQKISHTDWQIPKTMKREYREYFLKNIFEDFAKNLCCKFDSQAIEVVNMWFQIYKKGDFHDLHRHQNSHFTNVFFINLPNKNLKTKIYSLEKNIIDVSIEEGDILTFPGFLKHESVINNFEDEKIIISFNINLF